MANPEDLSTIEAEIKNLEEKRQAILASQRDVKLAMVRAAISQYSFTASELGIKKSKRSSVKSELPAKYQNPANPAETWHGSRGAKPKWVKAFLGNGGKLESIEIK